MKLGKHVFSEVLPVQTMKEAVELLRIIKTNTDKLNYYEDE